MTDTDPFAVMAEHAGHTDAPDGSGCVRATNLDQKKCAPWFLAYNSPPVRLVRRVADEIREYFPEGDDRSLEWAAGGAIGALLEEGWLGWPAHDGCVRAAAYNDARRELANVWARVVDAWDEGFAAGKQEESDAYWSAGPSQPTANPYR